MSTRPSSGRRVVATLLTTAATALSCAGATAAILVDDPPGGPYVSSFLNVGYTSIGQNFLVRFTLDAPTVIDGFDLHTHPLLSDAKTGTPVRVKIRADVAGEPEAANLHDFIDAIDAELPIDTDAELTMIDFATPVTLAAGSYWIGASGWVGDLTWNAYDDGIGTPADQRKLGGDGFVTGTACICNLAHRIRGEPLPAGVPEPGPHALIALALTALLVRRRGGRR